MIVAVAGVVTVVLTLFAGGYGYHRDELYFIAAGKHLDWAYADQGPLTPLLARAMTELAPESLTVLRLPSALAAGVTVLLTGLLARELGGTRGAQVLAAMVSGLASIVLVTGHLLSTGTFDLLCWTAATLLIVRAVRRDERMWFPAGVVLGIGLLNKPLPAFLAVGVLAGLIIAGPRHVLRSRCLWGGAVVAAGLFLPFLIWQGAHGWPQLEVSSAIAAGGSTSPEPWLSVVPFQFLLVSPVLAPIWIIGIVRLFRTADLRFLGWTWVLLAVAFSATGGKPYYLAGLLPVLIAAGCVPLPGWLRAGRATLRRLALATAMVATAVINAAIALPVLPVDDLDVVLAVNEDVGETVGWPEFVATVADAHARATPDGQTGQVAILTANYGEAAAIDRYGPKYGLPAAHSGHNAYGDWGPPDADVVTVIVVGMTVADATEYFKSCNQERRITNDAGIDNEERGAPVLKCTRPRAPWSQLWPKIRHLG